VRKLPSTSLPRRRRLPVWITLLSLLITGLISWNVRGREHHRPGPVQMETPLPSAFLEGTVVGVSDGDTVTVLDASRQPHKIRLLGIDAPEKAQPFGKVAKQILSDRIYEKHVRVQEKSLDRYGRTLGKILLEDADINLEMVKAGLAWHYKHYADDQFPGDAELYAQAEAQARGDRLGLWAYGDPVEPWAWRQEQKRASHRK